MTQSIRLEPITPTAFAPFGQIIDWSEDLAGSGINFHILTRSERATGWRLAVLRVVEPITQRLHNHPDTLELFAPIAGHAVLLVAEPGTAPEKRLHAFLLDRPVCLNQSVWHANLVLGEVATILIAENLEVEGVYSELPTPVSIGLVES